MSGIDILYLVLVFFCIVLSAFFSGSETALTSVQRIRLQTMVDSNVRGAKRLSRMLEKPERFLSTVLLGNNFVNTAAAALATILAVSFWGQNRGVAIATVGLTILLLIFGESTPKTIAARHAEKLSLAVAHPIEILSWLLTPLVMILSWIASVFTRMVGGTPVHRALTSAEEIRTMITVGNREGTVEKEEAEMLHNVFDFGDRPVREVMVPRLEVVSIEQGSKISDYFALYAGSPMSRIPVYKENMDNVVGIVTDKDVLMGLSTNTLNKDTPIDDLIRPAYFTPETKRISKLFTEMRNNNYRMAIVVDEYGGTAGIVSLTRMVEEIVGEVRDEVDSSDKDFEVINEYTFQVDGSMRLDEVNEEMDLELPPGDYETVAGFMLSRLGHIPRQGEQLRYKNLKLVVTKMKNVKIEEILITREGHAATAH